jgi:hypothetical protein
MNTIYQPTKQQIREWLNERRASSDPLPDIEQIQRQLKWKFVTPTTPLAQCESD